MNRRTLLLATALTLPSLAFADGLDTIEYDSSDPIQTALTDGKTVFVDFAAEWCGTCRRQERIINALREANPAYDANLVFVRVDWDDFRDAPVTTERNIPRRSTLLVLKGEQELGRIVAGTREAEIKALLDQALSAATGA